MEEHQEFGPPAFPGDLEFSDGTPLDLEKKISILDSPGRGAGTSDEVDLAVESSEMLPDIDVFLLPGCSRAAEAEEEGEDEGNHHFDESGSGGVLVSGPGPSFSRSSTLDSVRSNGSCESFVSAASRLEPYAEREELEKMFAAFDENGDGRISCQELGNTMRKLGYEVSESELESMVLAVDNDGDGFVDFNEFLALYSTLYYEEEGHRARVDVVEDEVELKEAFEVFDRNKDGFISVVELQAVLSSLGLKEGAKMVDCQKMIRAVDLDGDGQVNFNEFKSMMSSGLFNKQE